MKNKEKLYALSEEEYKSEIKPNFLNQNLEKQKESIPNPCDFFLKLTDGRLFEKYAIEYTKKILLNFSNNNFSFKENQTFNFYDLVQIFANSEHSEDQTKLFEEIINLKSNAKDGKKLNNAEGDFDFIINNIKGNEINKAIKKYKYNIINCFRKEITAQNYNIICEIKKDIFRQIYKSSDDIERQFTKYQKIITLLSSEPNLGEIKKQINIEKNNKLIFCVITNGDYQLFDYMTRVICFNKKYSQENYSEEECREQLPQHYKIFTLFKNLNIPILIIFVPKPYNLCEFKPKVYKDFEKQIQMLTAVVASNTEKIAELTKKLEDKEKKKSKNENEIENQKEIICGKKRKRSKDKKGEGDKKKSGSILEEDNDSDND